MKSLLYHAFGVKGFRYLRTRYEGGEMIFEVEPEKEPEVPAGQKLRRHGYRWRTVRSVSIGLKPVVLKVKVPRWLNTTTGEEFEQTPPLSKPTQKLRVRSRD
jgi:transposase